MNVGGFGDRKVADKRSVFDSDFIGREGKLNPRTVKEISMAVGLCLVLTVVFYFNSYQKKVAAQGEEELTLADPAVLEKIKFETSWSMPEEIEGEPANPMLDINKLLEYQKKYANEIEALEPVVEEKAEQEPKVELKRIKIAVKGILWNPDGESTALIDREMLKENQQYKGYTVAKVLRQAVLLTDSDGNTIRLNVGEDKEIIATEIIEAN
jgi:hypothetical protein